MSIGRNKVSSHLVIPSCGGRGVPGSAFYVAWLAEELIHGNKIILYTIMFRAEDWVEESKGERGLQGVQEQHA